MEPFGTASVVVNKPRIHQASPDQESRISSCGTWYAVPAYHQGYSQGNAHNQLATLKPGAGGEIQLTDALVALMAEQNFWGFKFEGETYDCGDKMGFLLANAAHGLERDDIGPTFRKALAKLLLGNEHLRQGGERTAA